MKTATCADVQAWLANNDDPALLSPPPPALCEHVSDCDCCRAALLLLAAELFRLPLDGEETSCDRCQEDLAPYIDREREEGMAVAARAYPHVWWHLWVCPECLQVYQIVTTLQTATTTRRLDPMPLVSLASAKMSRKVRPVIRDIFLPRAHFVRVPMPNLGLAWGAYSDKIVVHDDQEEGYEVRAILHKRATHWVVSVTIIPSLAGDVVVTLGTASFRTPLGPDGIANIDVVPPELLTSPEGPDMTIRIEAPLD